MNLTDKMKEARFKSIYDMMILYPVKEQVIEDREWVSPGEY